MIWKIIIVTNIIIIIADRIEAKEWTTNKVHEEFKGVNNVFDEWDDFVHHTSHTMEQLTQWEKSANNSNPLELSN